MNITSQLFANQRFQELIEINNKNDEAHDLAHFLRVKKYSLIIGVAEHGDLEIIEAAAMLHDIARGLETIGKTEDHLVEGAIISKEILAKINFPSEKISPVSYIVSVHQKRDGVKPETLEAKIVQDADLVDTYGLIYAARSILWGVQSEKYKRPLFIDENFEKIDQTNKNLSTLHYLKYRLTDPKYDISTLHTETAKKLASERLGELQNFVDSFVKEWRGEL